MYVSGVGGKLGGIRVLGGWDGNDAVMVCFFCFVLFLLLLSLYATQSLDPPPTRKRRSQMRGLFAPEVHVPR